jgi:hypothetical protein
MTEHDTEIGDSLVGMIPDDSMAHSTRTEQENHEAFTGKFSKPPEVGDLFETASEAGNVKIIDEPYDTLIAVIELFAGEGSAILEQLSTGEWECIDVGDSIVAEAHFDDTLVNPDRLGELARGVADEPLIPVSEPEIEAYEQLASRSGRFEQLIWVGLRDVQRNSVVWDQPFRELAGSRALLSAINRIVDDDTPVSQPTLLVALLESGAVAPGTTLELSCE